MQGLTQELEASVANHCSLNDAVDSTPMPIDMTFDSRYWQCDSCESFFCEGCGENRADPDRVVCGGDNPDEAESEAKRIQSTRVADRLITR